MNAAINNIEYHVGCSGFHYKHWKGNFYPGDLPATKWFEFYCKHFKTLELNVTFYRFPKLSSLQQWYNQSPDDFKFSVKVPRSITHFKKLNDTTRMLNDFYGLVGEGLKEKLGSVLFQFPPNFSYTEEHIRRIIDSVDSSFENVAEFRHSSWWNQDAINALGERQIAFCGMSHPDFSNEIIGNTAHLYYRMHGYEQLYTSGYTTSELIEIFKKIQAMKYINRAYIYFNNDVEGYAPRDAENLINILDKR